MEQLLKRLLQARHAIAFTGAGISVESGIPPFRGELGIWNRYDPASLEIGYFHQYPNESWKVIREVFYTHFQKAKPNRAHEVLAQLEEAGILKAIITQNIDNLHQEAGSKHVIEFHGNSRHMVCPHCALKEKVTASRIKLLPVKCNTCGALMKPDFVFFGEQIPDEAHFMSLEHARMADMILIIGAEGEVYPAAQIPFEAKSKGAYIAEINPKPSAFTPKIVDAHYAQRAGEAMSQLAQLWQR